MNSHLTENNVQHAIPASSIQPCIPKSTITKRNAKLKKGVQAKKVGGLAGKKVSKADFETLEKSVKENDHMRLSISSTTPLNTSGSEKNDVSEESVGLAYQDILLKEKQNDTRLNYMDENKREQATRLGMGFGKTADISHTVDLFTIDQVDPVKQSRRARYGHNSNINFSDRSNSKRDLERISRRDVKDEDNDNESMSRVDFSYSGETECSIVEGPNDDVYVFQTASAEQPDNNIQKSIQKSSDSNMEGESGKYRNMKAISSDMLFGVDSYQSSSGERLRKFEGRTSISSDDFVDHDTSRPSDVKRAGRIRDGMKESVRSVAGKISNMASGIAVTLKDRYG